MAEDKNNEPTAPTASIVPSISNVRLHIIIVGLWLCLFISAMDTTIITTALIKISSQFHALDQAAWLVTAYLLTYNSFLMITAKLSDVWGLKIMLIACNVFFLIWSMACGAAQSMEQLIVFRALQGIGGSGLYSLVFVAIVKLVVPEKLGFYSGIISSVFALANLLGPLLGGIIADHTDWRWIFWINGPITATATVIIFFSMPGLQSEVSTKERLLRFDGFGGILSVCWPVPLLFALQEAGIDYEWKSGVIIGTLVAGIALLFLFGLYESTVSHERKVDPMLPTRFITDPATGLLILSMFLLGMPFLVMFIQLPQRFQGVNFTSAERAGILLLPMTLLTPIGAMIAGAMLGRNFPAEYMLIGSTAIISIGIGLFSSLPTDSHVANETYAYEVITGLGLGLASPPYFMMLYTSVDEKDAPIGTGTLNMVRTLGGAVAVAICTALHHSVLRNDLFTFLSPEQISAIEDSSTAIAQLSPHTREELGRVFGRSYNKQFQVMLAFTLLNFLVSIALAIVRKKKGIFGKMPVRKEVNEFMKSVKKEEGGSLRERESDAKQETQVNEMDAQERPSRREPDNEVSASVSDSVIPTSQPGEAEKK